MATTDDVMRRITRIRAIVRWVVGGAIVVVIVVLVVLNWGQLRS
jgi:hypothetical protein